MSLTDHFSFASVDEESGCRTVARLCKSNELRNIYIYFFSNDEYYYLATFVVNLPIWHLHSNQDQHINDLSNSDEK